MEEKVEEKAVAPVAPVTPAAGPMVPVAPMSSVVPVENQIQLIPDNPLAKLFAQGNKLTIHPKCPVCNSKYRAEADAMHEKAEPFTVICKFLVEKGEAVAVRQVQYHCQAHYGQVVTELAIAEYAENMSEMVKRRRSMVDDMEHLIAAGWMEFARVAVLQTKGLSEEHQRQKMLIAAATMIREGHEFMKSLQDGEARAKMTEDKFVKVWTLKIQTAASPQEKDALMATLKDFQEKLRQP